MMLEHDALYNKIRDQVRFFKAEATKHRRLNRGLWLTSAIISLIIAFSTNFSFEGLGVQSSQLASGLSILLPLVTAYTVLRSPRQLWILEVDMRNRLKDLMTRMEVAAETGPGFDRDEILETYLSLMNEANQTWVEIKKGQ